MNRDGGRRGPQGNIWPGWGSQGEIEGVTGGRRPPKEAIKLQKSPDLIMPTKEGGASAAVVELEREVAQLGWGQPRSSPTDTSQTKKPWPLALTGLQFAPDS